MSSSEPIVKAKQCAQNKYMSVCETICREADERLIEARAQLAARGLANSGPMAKAVGDSYAARMTAMIQARVDALIDGFELYGVPITDDLTNYIIKEASDVQMQTLMQMKQALNMGAGGVPHGRVTSVIQSLEWIGVPVAAIHCQIEERRMKPRMAPQQPSVTNVYHLYGHNPRVNVESTDQSVNVVTTTSDQLFVKIREKIQFNVPAEQQREILARLDALEKAQNTLPFGERYTEFIDAAANHMTLIAPFIPALSELLHKVLRMAAGA